MIADRGFTLIELVIAMGLVLAITGALLAAVPPARVAFSRIPAELDMQQRGRTAADVVGRAVREGGWLRPSVEPDRLTVVIPAPGAAQGVASSSQALTSDPIVLATAECPNVTVVCGFAAGTMAAIVNASGEHDVFEVAAVSAGLRRLSLAQALSRPYGAGSRLIEVEQHAFYLAEQADASFTLTRNTADGAVQPIVDFVSELSFEMVAGGRIDMSIRVHPTPDGEATVPSRVFRSSIKLRNVP